MAPKRKAPISGTTPAARAAKPTAAGLGFGKPKPAQQQQQQGKGKKRSGGGGPSTAGPSKPKKARVDVEYEGGEQPSAKGKGVKGKGKGPLAPAAAADDDDDVPAPTTANSKGKKLAFAGEPSTSAAAAAAPEAVAAPKPKRAAPTGPKTFQVVAGSYEKLLYGLQGVVPDLSTPAAERDYSIKPIFIFPAHQACVKTVAAAEGGKWLATGSSDEVVKIWDLRRRKEVGGLQQHTGSITSLHFPSRTHLLTASEDSTLTLFRTRDWAVLRSFKGHVGRVNSVRVHPTGKLALSLGKDRTLKMWDLMKGKAGGSVKLGKEGELVRFSPSGAVFAILSTTTIDLYNTDMSPLTTLTNAKRFHDFHFVSLPAAADGQAGRELLVAAVEEGYTRVFECVKPEAKEVGEGGKEGWGKTQQAEWTEVARLVGHSHRVKAISPLYPLLTSVSSDGFINLYDLSLLPPSSPSAAAAGGALPELAPVSQYDTKKTRLTCVVLAEGGSLELDADGLEPESSSDEDDEDEDEMDELASDDDDDDASEGASSSGEDGMVEQEDEDEEEAEFE